MEPLAPGDPTALGRFRLTAHLGSGGMGRVYLGVDAAGVRVAVKVVHAELAADPTFRERFRREVAMAAAVPPWFTAPVVDAAPDADPPWLATAYVEGPSLHEHAPLGERAVYDLAARLAAGLATVHAGGLVHRDLKPSNILLAADGPRVIDFGIARAADTTALTQTGHVLGTPEFMSPEQASGSRDIGPPSDVFALGSVVVFAATGRSPFVADNPAGALYNVVYAEPALGPLHGPMREVVARCLAKDPAARPTAAQVADALHAPAPPTPVRSSRWPQVAAVVGACAVVAAVAVGAVLFFGAQGTAPPAPIDVAAAAPTAPTTELPPTSELPPPTVVHDAGIESEYLSVVTPSGNITCSPTQFGAVRCDVAEQTWQLPPAPDDCTGAWGVGTFLPADGPGEILCASDTFFADGTQVLAYGEAVRYGAVVCVSRETGLRCENEATGHGMTLSRARFELF